MFSTPLNIFKVTVYQIINNIKIDTMNCTHTGLRKSVFTHNYIIQQNSFNPMSDNSEILIIRTLRVVPKTGSFDFYQNKVSSLKWVDLTDMFKRPPRVSVHQLLWYFLASCLLSSTSTMKTPENKDEDLDDPVPGDAQMK